MEQEGQEGEVEFLCSGCGACCMQVGQTLANIDRAKEPYKSELKKFPYKAKEDGSCEILGEDGKCQVYDDRPDVCNVTRMVEKHFSGQGSKKEQFRQRNLLCNVFIAKLGLDSKYMIDTSQYDN